MKRTARKEATIRIGRENRLRKKRTKLARATLKDKNNLESGIRRKKEKNQGRRSEERLERFNFERRLCQCVTEKDFFHRSLPNKTELPFMSRRNVGANYSMRDTPRKMEKGHRWSNELE